MNVGDLIDICKNSMGKKIFLILDDKKIPMSTEYYIANDIVFFEVDFKNKIGIDDYGFIWEMEREAEEDDCWKENIYEAPMERLGGCELEFPKDFKEVIENDEFDNCYEIIRVQNLGNEIRIYLK